MVAKIYGAVAALTASLALSSASAQVLDAGGNHSLRLRSDGTVAAWGYNGNGQTSDAPTTDGFTAVAGGQNHSLALRSDGTVAAWGNNGNGQSTVPSTLSGATAIAGGGRHSLALRSDGTVAAWGYDGSGQTSGAAAVRDATAVSAGIYHSLALRSNGTVAAWGDDTDGRTAGAASVSGATAITGGYFHSLALRSNGSVAAWGTDSDGQVSGAATVTGATAIAAGKSHSLALRSDGTVAAWGNDSYGKVSGASALSNVVYVSAGEDHNFAVHSDGRIAGWGRNLEGQLEDVGGLGLPTVARWSGAMDGDYLNSHRWDQQIPSTALSTAVFDSSGTYAVSFGNDARAQSLAVSGGNLAFVQSGNAYQVEGPITVSGAETSLQFDGLLSGNAASNAGLITVASGGVLAVGSVSNMHSLAIDSGGVVSAGAVTNTGLLNIASGGLLSGASVTNAGTIVNDGALNAAVTTTGDGLLTGSGSINGTLTISSGGTLAPGGSIGSMEGTDASFKQGGVFDFEINDATGGIGAGWDGLRLSGALHLDEMTGNPFLVKIRTLDLANGAGMAANFDPSQDYSWSFVTASGGIAGFDAHWFSINTDGFLNERDGGSFSIAQMGNDLMVNYNSSVTAVPEPASLALLGLCGLGWAGYRRRCRRQTAISRHPVTQELGGRP